MSVHNLNCSKIEFSHLSIFLFWIAWTLFFLFQFHSQDWPIKKCLRSFLTLPPLSWLLECSSACCLVKDLSSLYQGHSLYSLQCSSVIWLIFRVLILFKIWRTPSQYRQYSYRQVRYLTEAFTIWNLLDLLELQLREWPIRGLGTTSIINLCMVFKWVCMKGELFSN